MKRIAKFIQTMVVGGVFVVLPVAVLVLVILQMDEMLYTVVSPVAELFPDARVGGVDVAHILAVLLIIVFFFLAGWIARTRIGTAVQRGFENAILMKIPGYAILKSLSLRFSGDAIDDRFSPAVYTASDGVRIVGVITEECGDEVALYVPLTPTPGVGTLQFVRKDKIERLSVPISSVLNAYWQLGVGSEKIFKGGKAADG